ncbi:MAG: S8 family serine peptidase [Cellulomonas sp.]|uniref:S8 family serine peptidase n=1 Tax=Cellulomonas sp. TaxID=40001 RepID=UPI001A051643|nr:S8 family serine peptidase [Cellulomonas sp.]MBF0688128.1 S8 family serine peptidase [Cellulomonas sp.]
MTENDPRSDGGTTPHGSVFDEHDVVRGEVLVTLTPSAAQARTASVPVHPGPAGGSAVRALGIAPLDEVLTALGAHDIVQLAPDAGVTATRALDGGRARTASPLARTYRVPTESDVDEAVEQLVALDEVESAEPNRWREATQLPNDPLLPDQWGLAAIDAPSAWDVSTGSSSVVVAVVDTGVDLAHPELAPLLVQGSDQVDFSRLLPKPGWRFDGDVTQRDSVPADEIGHGTHVAGTISALSNNGIGVAGVGWQTRIMPVRVLGTMVNVSDTSAPIGYTTGVGTAADIAAGITWATDHGAHVINLSLGGAVATAVEQAAVDHALANDLVVVAAMGNDGTAVPFFPAAFPGVVAVGSVGRTERRSSFSQTGPHIDLVAPGEDVLSTWPGQRAAWRSGTSMAAPHVSGVAALLRAVSPGLTAARVADVLRRTARPLRDDPADPVPNDRYGHGILDAGAAVRAVRRPVLDEIIITKLRSKLLVWCPAPTLLIKDCPDLTFLITVLPPRCDLRTSPVICESEREIPSLTTPLIRTIGRPDGLRVRSGDDPFGLVRSHEVAYVAGHAAAMQEVRDAVEAYGTDLFEEQ